QHETTACGCGTPTGSRGTGSTRRSCAARIRCCQPLLSGRMHGVLRAVDPRAVQVTAVGLILWCDGVRAGPVQHSQVSRESIIDPGIDDDLPRPDRCRQQVAEAHDPRSEEHTSELQSRFDLVCRLLLAKKTNAGFTY